MQRRKEEGQTEAVEDEAKGLRNQFNFSERTSQTNNNPTRERGTMTEPPPSVEYSGQATQWELYDSYAEDQERKREAEKRLKKGKAHRPAEAHHRPRFSLPLHTHSRCGARTRAAAPRGPSCG